MARKKKAEVETHIELTPQQEEISKFIDSEFSGKEPISRVNWDQINIGDDVIGVMSAGIITNRYICVYFPDFKSKLLKGKVVKKFCEGDDNKYHFFNVHWSYEVFSKKFVKINSKEIIHDVNGLTANNIFIEGKSNGKEEINNT
jgi:hypothetical protein